jgi:TolB protein
LSDYTSETPPEPVRLTNETTRVGVPDYSSDGRVSFVQTGQGTGSHLWVLTGNGSERLLVAESIAGGIPQWSRDGRRLLFRRGEFEEGDFYWLDLTTRRATAAGVSGRGIRSARLSPDDRSIAFHRIEGGTGVMNVFVRPLGPGEERQITSDGEAVAYPAWSPDGRRLAVEIKRGDQTFLGVVDARGGAVEQLNDDRGQSWPHSWSPDGHYINFSGERQGVWNVYQIDVTTKAVRQLTRFTSPAGLVNGPANAPTAARLVFQRSIYSSNVWLLTPN